MQRYLVWFCYCILPLECTTAIVACSTLYLLQAQWLSHRKKKVKYNHCILFIYVMFAIIVCTNTTISHCLNEGENKMHPFYNIM